MLWIHTCLVDLQAGEKHDCFLSVTEKQSVPVPRDWQGLFLQHGQLLAGLVCAGTAPLASTWDVPTGRLHSRRRGARRAV
eukprot:360770-Chlamydomonas_euryale.AAC.2